MRSGLNPRVCILLTLVSLVVGGAAVYWQFTQYTGHTDDVENLKKQLRNTDQVKKELQASEEALAASQAKLEHLEKGVPQFAYIPTLMKELETVGLEHGIRVTGVKPAPPKKAKKKDEVTTKKSKKNYEVLSIEVEGRGTFRSVMAFLDALKTFPKIVSVRAVSLSPKNDRDADASINNLEVSIEIRAFLFAEPAVESKLSAQASGGQDGIAKG